MFTKRAARAATNPAMLGAADARWGLPGYGFVETFANCAETLLPAGTRQRISTASSSRL
jgi:hypothetical protein